MRRAGPEIFPRSQIFQNIARLFSIACWQIARQPDFHLLQCNREVNYGLRETAGSPQQGGLTARQGFSLAGSPPRAQRGPEAQRRRTLKSTSSPKRLAFLFPFQ